MFRPKTFYPKHFFLSPKTSFHRNFCLPKKNLVFHQTIKFQPLCLKQQFFFRNKLFSSKNSKFNKILLKLWHNSETQNLWQNLKKNLNCQQSSKSQIMINSKTLILTTKKLKFWQVNLWQNIKQSYGKNNLVLWQPMRCSRWRILQSWNIFLNIQPNEKKLSPK